MEIGIIGLGRMGMNMARRLIQGGHRVVAYNRTPARADELANEGGEAAYSLAELAGKLKAPRVVWLMLPAGETVDTHIDELRLYLDKGDCIVEGGNSNWKDAVRRAEYLDGYGIGFLDAGVSGGIWGLEVGYCTMVGGRRDLFERIEPLLKTLAPEDGYIHCGETGSGHFTKMIHNGIEYGMMQAYAEGFALMEASPFGKNLDYEKLSHTWNRGSVIRSWLLELAEDAFRDSPRLGDLCAYVEDSGEGRWTVQAAVESGVSAPVLTLALMERFRSRENNSFADRLLAALRQKFGGHAVKAREDGAKNC